MESKISLVLMALLVHQIVFPTVLAIPLAQIIPITAPADFEQAKWKELFELATQFATDIFHEEAKEISAFIWQNDGSADSKDQLNDGLVEIKENWIETAKKLVGITLEVLELSSHDLKFQKGIGAWPAELSIKYPELVSPAEEFVSSILELELNDIKKNSQLFDHPSEELEEIETSWLTHANLIQDAIIAEISGVSDHIINDLLVEGNDIDEIKKTIQEHISMVKILPIQCPVGYPVFLCSKIVC